MNVRYKEPTTLRDVRAYREEEWSSAEGTPRTTFDLSSNELVLPPLLSVLTGMENCLPRLARYPDPTARALADHAAMPSLRDESELRERLAAVAAAREELTADLRELGLPVVPSRANFVRLPLASAAKTFTGVAVAA